LHNLPAGDWAKGERGVACIPGREEEFRDGVATAISYAKALQCRQLNCLVGVAPKDAEAGRVRATLVANLRYAARELESAGVKLLAEPVNPYDIPGFYLSRTDQALALFDEVGERNLLLQYDVYHAQRTEGELAATMAKHLDRIAHIQVADNPGRNEPGTGEINYGFLFGRLDELGYDGWVGCEYKPRTTTLEGLGWLSRAAIHA
jgi:hydroxypyruvate isomerase